MALAFSVVGTPLVAEAQSPGKPPKVGVLFLGTSEADASRRLAFRDGLRELGWLEGQIIVFESRVAPGNLERKYAVDELVSLATELVRQPVNVIVAFGTTSSQVARQATATIPFIMAAAENPVGMGLVESLARPGGNVTEVTLDVLGPNLNAKRLELAKQALLGVSRVSVSYTQSRASNRTS